MTVIEQAEEWLSCYPDSYVPTKMWKEIISGLLSEVRNEEAHTAQWVKIAGENQLNRNGLYDQIEKLESENAALKEEMKNLKNNNQWYADYANDTDKDVTKWIGEANKLEVENAALKEQIRFLTQEVASNDETIDEMQIERGELKKLNHKLKENNTVLNLFVKDQDHTIEIKCDEIESLRGTAAQLARAVLKSHNNVRTRCDWCKFYVDEMCESYDDDGPCPDCQCVDCAKAREVLG